MLAYASSIGGNTASTTHHDYRSDIIVHPLKCWNSKVPPVITSAPPIYLCCVEMTSTQEAISSRTHTHRPSDADLSRRQPGRRSLTREQLWQVVARMQVTTRVRRECPRLRPLQHYSSQMVIAPLARALATPANETRAGAECGSAVIDPMFKLLTIESLRHSSNPQCRPD